MRRRLIAATGSLGLLIALTSAAAAGSTAAPDSSCTYRRCALAVVPAWNGLDLVRGEQEEHTGRLGFFWTRDLSPAFAGEPRAIEFARRAVRTRRVAAVLTDTGGALLAVALAGALAHPNHHDTNTGLAIGGAAAFGIAVPLQFAADGHLSRAVWWHNARFAR